MANLGDIPANTSMDKSAVGLGNVDNTSDANKPVSTAQQTALNLKVPTTTTVNGHALSSNVSVTQTDVGLGNVQNVDQTNGSNISSGTVGATRIASSIPQWTKVTKTFADFSTAGLTNSITILNLAANQYIHDIKILPATSFSGGLIASYTISVGVSGSLVKYAIAVDSFTANTSTNLVHTPLAGLESISGSTSILATAISTVGNLNAATQGAVTFYLLISTLT